MINANQMCLNSTIEGFCYIGMLVRLCFRLGAFTIYISLWNKVATMSLLPKNQEVQITDGLYPLLLEIRNINSKCVDERKGLCLSIVKTLCV